MDELNQKKKKKHLLYRIFNPEGSGKGVDNIPDGPDNIKKCFAIYRRNITNLLYINLMMIFGNFPILFALLAISGIFSNNSLVPSSKLYPVLHGVTLHENNPVLAALSGIHGIQKSFDYPTLTTYILFGLTLLVIFTLGPVKTGTTYLLRSMVRREPIFFKTDFFGSIKRNFPQCLYLGIVDGIALLALILGTAFYFFNGSALFYVNLIIAAMYLIMRFYIYLLMITFDLSIWKIYKNAVIFMLVAFRRNMCAFLGCLLVVGIEFVLLSLYYPLGAIFPFVVMVSTCAFFGAFAAYPKIKEIMIDPYYAKQEEEKAAVEASSDTPASDAE